MRPLPILLRVARLCRPVCCVGLYSPSASPIPPPRREPETLHAGARRRSRTRSAHDTRQLWSRFSFFSCSKCLPISDSRSVSYSAHSAFRRPLSWRL